MVREILSAAFARGASAMHIQANLPVVLFVDGELCPSEFGPFPVDVSDDMIRSLLDGVCRGQLEATGSVTCSGCLEGQGSYRLGGYRERGALGARLHLLSDRLLHGVRLPVVCSSLITASSGLLLVAGPFSSGITTTLAALALLANRSGRSVLSLEDPVEYRLPSASAFLAQLDVHRDNRGWPDALRQARASQAEVVVLSQLRESERWEAALALAEGGKLVLAGLNAIDTTSALRDHLERLERPAAAAFARRLADCLVAVLSPRLVPSFRGRELLHEVLVATPKLRELLAIQHWFNFYSIMQKGQASGMQTLEQAIVTAVTEGAVSVEAAFQACLHPEDLERMLRRERFLL
jgi:twitching motility protein PilT